MLDKLLNSQTKAIVLTRLFTPETPKYHLRQLARDGGISAPGLLKELAHFHELQLVVRMSLQQSALIVEHDDGFVARYVDDLVELRRQNLFAVQLKIVFSVGSFL